MKKIKQGLVPKLRFREFEKDGEWEEKKLGEICGYSNGLSHENSVTEKGDYYLISLNSIDINGKLKPDMKRLSNTDNSLQKDDLIMVLSDVAHGNFLGLVDIIPNDRFVLNQRMARLRIKESDLADVRFLRTFINSNQKYFKANGQGSSQLNLSKSSVTDFAVLFPLISEQQKIADCLSSLDELIEAEDQKLEALQRHKKGLMQELFPFDDQTLPRLRFPEFQSAPEWEEKTLGKISNTLQGYGFPEKHQGVAEGIYPFYKVSDISNSLHRGENFIKQAINYIDETTLKTLKAKLLPVGTTIFAKIGEAIRLNRRVITTAPCLIDNNVAGLKRIEGQATDLFLYYILLRINLAEHCGGAVPSVNKSTIEAIPVICPEPEEQKKIAEFLSSIDDLITSQNQKLKSLRLHKKGLMQQLFPNVSEAQG